VSLVEFALLAGAFLALASIPLGWRRIALGERALSGRRSSRLLDAPRLQGSWVLERVAHGRGASVERGLVEGLVMEVEGSTIRLVREGSLAMSPSHQILDLIEPGRTRLGRYLLAGGRLWWALGGPNEDRRPELDGPPAGGVLLVFERGVNRRRGLTATRRQVPCS
jgi:hypothetical protein